MTDDKDDITTSPRLKRELGVAGATMMGLGSIIGTGVFVSIGIAAGVAGPAVVLAVALAACVAMCNALSSAQLAANNPVSGGTYEYGYIHLHPTLGFTAGWMFLCAKSASAATAALGFSGYLLHTLDIEHARGLVVLAVGVVTVLTLIVLSGLRRSSLANSIIVSVTLLALVAFVLAGLPNLLSKGGENLTPFFQADQPQAGGITGLLYGTALMFVAYTGYGRIATMGEEIRDPRRNIPKAIAITLIISAVLYISVGLVAVATVGAGALSRATQSEVAPLQMVAALLPMPGLQSLIAIGAMTAMLGVLLNLILGLSRVVLAMGRRRDLPQITAHLHGPSATPRLAVAIVGIMIISLVCIGDVRTTWTFSAFTVLIYYAITNLAALRLSPPQRRYAPCFAWIGLGACLFLACWVDWRTWLAGLLLIALGLSWQAARQAAASNPR